MIREKNLNVMKRLINLKLNFRTKETCYTDAQKTLTRNDHGDSQFSVELLRGLVRGYE